VGGRVVGGGDAVVGGRDVAGDAGDVAVTVDPCADFVLTEPLGRVVPGLPGADDGLVVPPIGVAVVPPIGVAVAPPRDVVVGPALDVGLDRACRTACRAAGEEPHAAASVPIQITATTRTVARWA
jgi:hypothetical protein